MMNTVYSGLQATLTEQGITALLPAGVTAEQFTRTAATALMADSGLQSADRQSLMLALTRCAGDGLLPDGREAALVVRSCRNSRGQYEKRVVYLPMVDGVLKRARQSGQVSHITAMVVYTADRFDYRIDERGVHLKHQPVFEERGDIRLVYAFARLTSGDLVAEVMSRTEVDKVRHTVRGSDSPASPWVQWYDRMALKTVLHRLARRLPCAAEIIPLAEEEYPAAAAQAPLPAAEPPAGHTGPRLRDRLIQRRAAAVKPVSEPPAVAVSRPGPPVAAPGESMTVPCQKPQETGRAVFPEKLKQDIPQSVKPHSVAYRHSDPDIPSVKAAGAAPPPDGPGWRFPDEPPGSRYRQIPRE